MRTASRGACASYWTTATTPQPFSPTSMTSLRWRSTPTCAAPSAIRATSRLSPTFSDDRQIPPRRLFRVFGTKSEGEYPSRPLLLRFGGYHVQLEPRPRIPAARRRVLVDHLRAHFAVRVDRPRRRL